MISTIRFSHERRKPPKPTRWPKEVALPVIMITPEVCKKHLKVDIFRNTKKDEVN